MVYTQGCVSNDDADGVYGEKEITKLNSQESEGCSFIWDEKSQLYYHSSSGFYHDPTAGWYYSSWDGLYYKFENGNYVQMVSDEGDLSEICDSANNAHNTSAQDNIGGTDVDSRKDAERSCQGASCEARHRLGFAADEPLTAVDPDSSIQVLGCAPPPSEWLEDTLIELYLSGYANQGNDAVYDQYMPADIIHDHASGIDDADELEEGEWIPDEDHKVNNSCENISDEGVSWDEEQWRAQYGQVIYSGKREDTCPRIEAVDLWGWTLVKEPKKKRKRQVARLIGSLRRQSTNLHPSVPSRRSLLKTAPICEVQLDLVRVRSGQVYKLKSPSSKYLASLSTYDSSNPTKDWGFAELSFDNQVQAPSELSEKSGGKIIKGAPILKDLTSLPDEPSASKKHGGGTYRDRAAERRALHGGFGVGPGQKKLSNFDDCELRTVATEEAAGQACNMSFGSGSYARKLLESMGWKEGETLGISSGGLIEPLQAVGNKGNAGLGWDQTGRRHV